MSAGDLLATAEVPQPSGLIRLCGGRPGSCREGVRPEGARLLAGGKKAPTPKVTVMMIAVCQSHAGRLCVACHVTPISRAVPHDGGEIGTSSRLRTAWAGLSPGTHCCHCLPVGLQTECSLSLCFGLLPSKGTAAAVW